MSVVRSDLEDLERVQAHASSGARGALIRWCVRWAITIALFVYFVPDAPWLWWVLAPLSVLGVYNLVLIARMGYGVRVRVSSIRSQLQEIEESES